MPQGFILSIDQGTTGTRAILYDSSGRPKASAYQEFRQYYPRPGWVEHDALEILASVQKVVRRAIDQARISSSQIKAIGITNQRETVVLWERRTGKPVAHAIVWQDRRSAGICEYFRKQGLEKKIRKKTGLLLDPYFSGTKLKWLFGSSKSLRKRAATGALCFGTIDSWLLFHLSGRISHATDFTNASRTLLFNIKDKIWDDELLRIFDVPPAVLPKAKASGSLFGQTKNFKPLPDGIPIHALIGDQQAALYGQGCYKAGDSKNTYGTGCFLLLNTGSRLRYSHTGLLTTIACDAHGMPIYALEGAIFIAGAAIQWIRDSLKLIRKASETEKIARQTPEVGDLVVIPAFTGLGAPYWRADARGAIFGITRGTTREMIIKATLDSIALQVEEVFDIMKRESGVKPRALRVDGGATQNGYLMQLQADLLGVPILRANVSESTAWGAGKLAGVASGFWKNPYSLDRKFRYKKFFARLSAQKRLAAIARWKKAIKRLL